MTNVDALQELLIAVGGAETNAETNLKLLNAISGQLGGETTAESNAEAIRNIAQVASGGDGIFKAKAKITFTASGIEPETGFDFSELDATEVLAIESTIDDSYQLVQTLVAGGSGESVEYTLLSTTDDLFLIFEPSEWTVTVSGSATVDGDEIDITGDCAINAARK